MRLGKPVDAILRPQNAPLESLGWYLEAKSAPGPNDCIVWIGSVRSDGYGQIKVNNRVLGVHRVAYQLHSGEPIPPGMLVLHSCDRPLCINPAHLRLGTHAENTRDAIERGRRPGRRA